MSGDFGGGATVLRRCGRGGEVDGGAAGLRGSTVALERTARRGGVAGRDTDGWSLNTNFQYFSGYYFFALIDIIF